MLHNITDTPDYSQQSHFWFTLCTTHTLQEMLTLSSLDYGLGRGVREVEVGGWRW